MPKLSLVTWMDGLLVWRSQPFFGERLFAAVSAFFIAHNLGQHHAEAGTFRSQNALTED